MRGVALTLALAALAQEGARAQEGSLPPLPPASQPAAPVGVPTNPATPAGAVWEDVFNGPATQAQAPPPGYAPPPQPMAAACPKVTMSCLDVIRESICGPACESDWKPLSLCTFFSEGWDTPFANAPPGPNEAPKQNWIGAPAGIFGRFATLDFFYTNHLNNVPGNFLTPNAPFMPVHPFTNGNQYTGYGTIWLPLNSRFELVLGTVFIASNKTSPFGGYVGNWGDTGIQGRFHLIDQPNFSWVALIGERIPTGKSVNGNDINYVTPGVEAWWNFAPKWVLRGGSQVNILTGRKSSNTVYVNQLSLGRYLTDKDAAIFKQASVYVTGSVLSDTSGGGGNFVQDVYIFPGFRFSLDKGDKIGVLGGVQVPVSGPQAYVWQPQASLTIKW